LNTIEKEESGESLRQSLAYSAVGNLGARGISLLGFFVLARLLSPREFGIMAMVTVFTGIADLFLTMGMDTALIQNRGANERHYSTAFWINMFLGAIFAALLILGAKAIAGFYQESEIAPIIRTISVLYILNSIVIIPVAILKKRLEFKKIASIQLAATLSGLSVGIPLALNGWGVWALAANLLMNAVVEAILAFLITRWRPRLLFGKRELAELWNYSRYLVGSNIVSYAINNVDYLLIGRLLGAKTLGVYKYAFQIATFPRQVVFGVVNRVLISFYSSLPSKERMAGTHLKLTRVVAFIFLPFYFGLASIADHFVLTVLGKKWEEGIPFFVVLLVTFAIQILNDLNGPLYLAQGETKLLFNLSIFLRTDLIIFMVVGIYYAGINGLLFGLLLGKIINYFPGAYFAGRLVGLSGKDIHLNLAPMTISSVLMAAIVLLCKEFLFNQPGSVPDLIWLVLVGFSAYSLVSIVLQRPAIREFWQTLKQPGMNFNTRDED